MQIPIIRGIIDRRLLVNFRIDPEVMARVLPPPFRPKLAGGHAIGGICLIRLKQIRPRFVPLRWGVRSENAAHRVAVEWDVGGHVQEGVYIPRRDTDSRLNALAGGRIFPGLHHHASFTVEEYGNHFSVASRSDDRRMRVTVRGTLSDRLPNDSVFASVAEASKFFEAGSLGYSATSASGRYDGIELRCKNWLAEPLNVEHVESSYFEDESSFPRGSVRFDCALVMRGIDHEWHSREDLCCPTPEPAPGNRTADRNADHRG